MCNQFLYAHKLNLIIPKKLEDIFVIQLIQSALSGVQSLACSVKQATSIRGVRVYGISVAVFTAPV